MEDGEATDAAAGAGVTSETDVRSPAVIKESRSEVLSRHQKEIKELQNKEIGLKKAAAKGSKSEQKAKKKLVEEEIAKLDLKLKARHIKELAALGVPVDEKKASSVDNIAKALAGVTTDGANHPTRVSKGQKWRDKRAQKEADREQRILDEQSTVSSQRLVEDRQLKQKLQPLGLAVKEVKSDGHCLYRAVENQLVLHPELPQHDYQELRRLAADYMRSHPNDYMPFIAGETAQEDDLNETVESKFQKYCSDVSSTAAWGGQLELRALSHALKRQIIVYSGDLPDVDMGLEYAGASKGADVSSASPVVRVSFHRHAFGLGEHYNSVVPT